MIKLPNSIEPAVMAENIVHLRDEIAAVDEKTLPATTSATTGQILKLTGETKTPAWADEYSYTPPDYSSTEIATGQKWIDGKDVYQISINFNLPVIESTQSVTIGTLATGLEVLDMNIILKGSNGNCYLTPYLKYYNSFNGNVVCDGVSTTFSGGKAFATIYYTKPDPTPGRAPEDSDHEPEEPEEKKTAKKKTTK